MPYTFNGESYKTEDEANQAKAQYEQDRQFKIMSTYADAASVGYDEARFNALMASGGGLSQMSREERAFIQDRYAKSGATGTYTKSAADQYFASVGLPPTSSMSKYRTSYANYTNGGGFDDNYSYLTEDNWKKINELWSKDWEYGLTDADAARKALGLAPVSYDSMYEDTLLDDELKARGLPPSKLLNGKLGEAYNTWAKDSQDYYNFNADVARRYYNAKQPKNTHDESTLMGSALNAVDAAATDSYTMEQAYMETLADPKWATFRDEHATALPTMPNEKDDKYRMKDESGNYLFGDDGDYVYDFNKYNEDWLKAAEKQSKIDNDEFALTLDKAQEFYDKNAQDIIITDYATKYLNGKGISLDNVTEEQARDALSYAAGQMASGITIDEVFKNVNLTADEKALYQPVIDKFNEKMKTEGVLSAEEYWGSDEFKADINKGVQDNIVASYRQTYAGTSDAEKTDSEILDIYYSDLAERYKMPEAEAKKLRDGEITVGDYMATVCTDKTAARDYATSMHTSELTRAGLPNTKEGLENIQEHVINLDDYIEDNCIPALNRLQVDTADARKLMQMTNDELSAHYETERQNIHAVYGSNKEVEGKMLNKLQEQEDKVHALRDAVTVNYPEYYDGSVDPKKYRPETVKRYIKEWDATEVAYYAEALSFTPDFKEWKERVGNEHIETEFSSIISKYFNVAEGKEKQLSERATAEEKSELVYLFETEGTKTESRRVWASSAASGSTSMHMENRDVTVLSDNADIFLNQVLLREWDTLARNEQIEKRGWWGSESESGFARWALGGLDTLAGIPMTMLEGAGNLFADTGKMLMGNELTTSGRYNYFSDSRANIAQHIQEGWSGKVGSFAYQLVPSMAQSAAGMVAALYTGGASEWLTLALMASQSYSGAVDSALRKGASSEQAYALGLWNGVNEMLFEKVSLDHFVKEANVLTEAITAAAVAGKQTNKELARQFVWKMLKRGAVQGAVEGSEEVFTSIANLLADGIVMGYNSDFNRAVERYMKDGLGEKEAREKAGLEICQDVFMDFVGGFVSGALMSNAGDIHLSRTSADFAFARMMNDARNLSAVTTDEAMEIARGAALRDSNQKITKEGAQAIVDALKARGCDSSTLSAVLNQLDVNSEISGQDAKGVFDRAVLDMRNSEATRLAESAKKVVKRSNKRMSAAAQQASSNYLNATANTYLTNLSQTLQTADRENIAKAVSDVQNDYFEAIKRESGMTFNEGLALVTEYMSTIPQDELAQGAAKFVAQMNLNALKGGTKVSSKAAAYYGTYAYALTKMAQDANFTGAFTGLFNEHTADVSTNIANACLNSSTGSTIGFVDTALSAIGMYESMGEGRLAKTLGKGMNSSAFMASVLASCEASEQKSNSRLFYDYAMKNGVTPAVLDGMVAALYYDSMTEDSRARANKYLEKAVDAMMTSEEVQESQAEVASAETNVKVKQDAVNAQAEHNAQTQAAAENTVARHQASYDAVRASETTVIDGKVYQTTAAELADVAASYAAALSDAINARDNLAKANEQRIKDSQHDLELAEEKLKKMRTQFKRKMNRHAAAYMNMIGAQIATMRGGGLVSNAEFARVTALATYGMREDLNNAVRKIIDAEKRQAVEFANQIGSECHVVEFTDEFLAEHGAKGKNEYNDGTEGFEHLGRIYLNEKAFGTNKGARVGYGVDAVILHELSHVAEKAANNWQAYSKFACDYMFATDPARADRFVKRCEKQGKNWQKELTAEFTRLELLQNPRAVIDLCNRAPIMATRMHQWLSKVNAVFNNSLGSTSKFAEAERNFAKALRISNEKVKSGELDKTQANATKEAATIAKNLENANPEAVDRQTQTDTHTRESDTPVREDDYIPEAPSETDGYAYGEGINTFEDINTETTEDEKKPTELSREERQAKKWKPGDYDFTKGWKAQVDDVRNLKNGKDTRPYRDSMLMGRTPTLLRQLGFAPLPMLYTEKHALQNIEGVDGDINDDHVLDDVTLDEIYKAIENPVAIITAADDPNEVIQTPETRTRGERTVVMILDVKSKNGERVLTAVTLDGYGRINGESVDAHVVTSIHGKKWAAQNLVNAFYDEAKGDASVLYWNKTKVMRTLSYENTLRQQGKRTRKDGSKVNSWLHLPSALPKSSMPHTINDPALNVKQRIADQTQTKQFKRFAGENPEYVDIDGKQYVKGLNGKYKSMNTDENYGLFDRAIDDVNYFEDFNAEDYDDEYMELGERYRYGEATDADKARLRYLVDMAAMAKGIVPVNRNNPQDLYHGTPPWFGFGFTEFKEGDNPNQKNLTFSATNPRVGFSYTFAERAMPHTRELWKAGTTNADEIIERKKNPDFDTLPEEFASAIDETDYEDEVTWNDYVDLAEEKGVSPYDLLEADIKEILGDIKVDFGSRSGERTDPEAFLAITELERTIRHGTESGNAISFLNSAINMDTLKPTIEQFLNSNGLSQYSKDDTDFYIDTLQVFLEMAQEVANSEDYSEAKQEVDSFANYFYLTTSESTDGNIDPVLMLDEALQYLTRYFSGDTVNAFVNSGDAYIGSLGYLLSSYDLDNMVEALKAIAQYEYDENGNVNVTFAQEPPMSIGIDMLVHEVAKNRRAGMYHLYGQQTENPYELTSGNEEWHDIRDEQGNKGIYGRDRELAKTREGMRKMLTGELDTRNFKDLTTINDTNNNAEYARRLGYTMTRFNGIEDYASDTLGHDELTDDLIYYNQHGLKSADLITVDEETGDIVPLSQRFNWDKTSLNYYTQFDSDAQAIQSDIDAMTEADRARYGNPRLMAGVQGLMVARNVSMGGLMHRNPTDGGARNICVLERAKNFATGNASLMLSPIDLKNAVAVVAPQGVAYADARNAAYENGATVVTYDLEDPATFNNAINRAADADGNINYFDSSLAFDALIDEYGAINETETRRAGGRLVPQRTSNTNRVHRTMHTLANSQFTTDEQYEGSIKKLVENGQATYDPVSNARTLGKARSDIERLGGARAALTTLNSSVATNTGKNTELLAMAEAILMDSDAVRSLSQNEYEQLLTDVCLVAEDSGRSLQLLRELASLSPQGRINHMEQMGKRMGAKYEQKTKKPVELDLTEEEKRAFGEAKTPDEFEAIEEKISKRWGEKMKDLPFLDRVRNWRYFSMLGNLRTHFRNIVGNLLMYDLARVKDTVKAGYEYLAEHTGKEELRLTQAERTATAFTKRMDDATREFVEREKNIAIPIMQNASMKYYQAAKKYGNADKMTLSKFIEEAKKDVQSAHISNRSNKLAKALNKASSVNSNVLELEDAFSLGKRFKSVLAQQIQARGLDVKNMPEWQKKSMLNYAMEESLRATFRDASALADALSKFENTNALTKFVMGAIIPFKRTPINIVKRGIEYSPIGLVQGLYKRISNRVSYEQKIKAINESNISEKGKEFRRNEALTEYKRERMAAINRLAEGTTGSMLAAIGAVAGMFGWVSIGRKDDDAAAFETSLGKNSYSLNIGDLSIDLSAFSPAAIPLLLGVAFQGAFKALADNDDTFIPQLVTALTETLDPITEMTMLSGLADAMSGLSYSNQEDAANTKWAGTLARNTFWSFVGQFIPTFAGQVARGTDKYARSYSAGGEYFASKYIGTESGSKVKSLQNKLPFVAWLSEPKVDLHGNTVKNYTNFGEWVLHELNTFILPSTIKVDRKNEIDDELVRLYGVVDNADIFPTKPSRTLGSYTDANRNSVPLKLQNDEEYSRYQEEVGQVTYDALNDLINSQNYHRMTDVQKADAIEKVIKNARKSVKDLWKARKSSGK